VLLPILARGFLQHLMTTFEGARSTLFDAFDGYECRAYQSSKWTG
jgi:hypothetical protein